MTDPPTLSNGEILSAEERERRNRRREPRQSVCSDVDIMFGKDAKVFARLVNISGRGACVQLSNRFRMEIGETISLDGRFLGMARRFRIVGLSSGNLHLAACRF